ncbi:MAG: HYR domain-containing protein [Saprospiraceae bacterium]|uniref:HYR domain-containing protein n=1 Tax=Candidatus Opimibacter skivensis TaxID=2982028 RepID=A0A9D7XQW1_9BACT|nr:HYR domain-containing protein [Candidatus Opimibacter skivensis]
METLRNSGSYLSKKGCLMIAASFFLFIQTLSASTDKRMDAPNANEVKSWTICWDGKENNVVDEAENASVLALACKPNVNVSLGLGGYAVLTALTLVNAPAYPANQYDVDIMGPLNDTVFCAQLGLDVMVVVTELPTGNSCMSTVHVEDKLKPTLVCTSDTLPCNIDIPSINFESLIEAVYDNCDPDPDLWFAYTIQNLPCNPDGFTQIINVTWTATDQSGNSSTCVDVVYLKKPQISQIMFPANITVSCTNANIDPSVTGEPTYNGEPVGSTCQIVVYHSDQIVPMCNGSQKILRLWTVMDWCNSGTMTHLQEIRIIDNIPPVLICPNNVTVSAANNACTAKYTLPQPQVTDACSNIAMIDIDIFVSGVPGIFSPGNMVNLGVGTTTITIRATDPCGNSSMCAYNVTVRDNTPPTIICPGNITVDCNSSTLPASTGNATAFDGCDPVPIITYSDVTVATVNCAVGYIIMRTWKATDHSGNMSTCMQTIVLTDNTPPVISCPINLTIACTASTLPGSTGTATASDHCDATPTVTFSDVTIGAACPQERTIKRTWKATDDCGNSSTCLQTIVVDDNLAPVITCPPNVSIECSSSTNPSITGSATATDNCDSTPTITFTDVSNPTGPQEYTITRTWKATDDCGNSSTCIQLIIVHDGTPPVITCPNGVTIECTASTLPANTGTASATDNCDPTPTLTFTDVTVGGACPQERTITRTWRATDDCGNSSSCTQSIFVDDSHAPVISCPANMTIQCTASTLPGNTGTASATDNCDPSPTITFTDVTVGGACPQERTITRTWRATDHCGNSSVCAQTIFVDDSTAPIISCPGNVTIQCLASTLPANTGTATANDNCDVAPIITFTDAILPGICVQVGTLRRTWKATDHCGNSSTCLQTISIIDNTAPLITCPPNVTIQCSASTLPANTGTATATDNCAFLNTITFSDVTVAGSCPQAFTITRTWTASDGCGNVSTCSQIIQVVDTVVPVITCPQNITIECNSSTLPPITGTATATDNCDGAPIITFTDVTVAGGGCPLGFSISRTWRATDHCGNSSTCIQLVSINDLVAPAITCPPNITIQCNASTLPANTGTATATDVCDATPTITFSDVVTGGPCPAVQIITRTWVATDDCANSSSCVQTITITDSVAPLVTCPANVTIQCSASTAPANTGTATATDVCDASLAITFTDVLIGTACPQEFTVIRTWRATDDCGNTGTCNQTIVTDDTTAPVCVAVNITVSLMGNGMVTITGSQIGSGSTDNCGPVTLSVFPNTFTCANIGANLVTLTVTDCALNSSTCTATVTVNEGGGGLQASCQNVTIFLDVNGNASIDPSQINNGSGGGCNGGMLQFMLSQTNFNCTNLGPNIVTLTVTDQNGGSATCTAIVTVVDNMPPSITCPANVTVDCHTVTDPNNTGQFGNATATDNCPPAIITETHVLNLNNCNLGTIVRTFTAADGSGNTATCIQIVTIVNPTPLNLSNITWPPSPISVNICNSTEPQNIPNGVPVISPGALQCSNPIISHVDVTQMIIDNNPNTPCRIITRTWTIVDNCQMPTATFTFVQTINVQDMVPPLFTNINDMTKTANANCVAFFSLIASATDCAGVSITNNSPYGVNSGSNASGNYPIGVTIVLFTATDGCGNISTMDVKLTVVDPNPTTFMCEKQIVYLPQELEITLSARIFVIFSAGGCTDPGDFIVSYSGTNAFDTTRVFDCGDVGVSTFPLWFWNANGTQLVDSCAFADLELRDPDDFCGDGLVLFGNVQSEVGQAVSDVQVSISNAPMIPDTTDHEGRYTIRGLTKGTGYMVVPFNDRNPREGVSTLDLVLIQKHLLGITKLNSPYKLIAADANKSGNITALDLLAIRKLILGITDRFPNNTSWRFVSQGYEFPDANNPFAYPFVEEVWLDSISHDVNALNFIGVKIGDINGTYFLSHADGEKIEPRNSGYFQLNMNAYSSIQVKGTKIEITAPVDQSEIDGIQFSLYVGELNEDQIQNVKSDLLGKDDWYYDASEMTVNVSWSSAVARDISGKVILSIPNVNLAVNKISLESTFILPEAYKEDGENIMVKRVEMKVLDGTEATMDEYHLYQNTPNPFSDETVISFYLPKSEDVRLVIHDINGKQVFDYSTAAVAGHNDIHVKSGSLKLPGMYYYTLYTANASFTRKMSFTND